MPRQLKTVAERVQERKAEKEAIAERKRKDKYRTRDRNKKRKIRAKKKAQVTKEERDRRAAELKQQRAATLAQTQERLAAQELARRELARRRLLPFIHRFTPNYMAGWFHKDLCGRLEKFLDDVINQRAPRLMLFVPPRHGKSITVSQNFPAWALGKYPWLEFIATSYAETLQTDFSKKIQEMIRDEEYQLLFPGITIPKKHEAVSRWKLAKDGKLTDGGLLAAGVGGPLTGRGAHVGLIDDPVKNAEEADSETIRNAIKNWYSSTFYTRLAPGGGVLIVQTRWHDDDLSGWLLHEMAEAIKEEEETGVWPPDADRWEVISYPAIATEDEKYRKKGEALHPERFSLELLSRTRRTMIPRHWSALYQQNPVAEEGQYFTRDMIRTYQIRHRPPLDQLDIYCTGDLAISQRETADWSVFVVAGLDKDDNLWILDVRRGRWDTDELINEIVDIHKTWKPLRFGIEREKVAIAIGPPLNRRIQEDRLYGLVVEDLHIGGRDKRARARLMQGRMKQGKVLLPAEALWLEQWINEHLRFDAGVNDDCVDAGAWLAQMLADVVFQGRGAKKPKKGWKDKLKKYIGAGTGAPGSHMRA